MDFVKDLRKGGRTKAEHQSLVKSIGWDVVDQVKSNMKKEKKDWTLLIA